MSFPAVALTFSANYAKAGRQSISYAELMKPDEDWRMLPDNSERRKIQNRLAQRAYSTCSRALQSIRLLLAHSCRIAGRNMRGCTKELEKLRKEIAQLKNGKDESPEEAAAAAAVLDAESTAAASR
jgi:hypothetical protein